jgi:hypothetical protein
MFYLQLRHIRIWGLTAGDSIILKKEIADALLGLGISGRFGASSVRRIDNSVLESHSHHSGFWSRAGVSDVSGCDVGENLSGSARVDFPEEVSGTCFWEYHSYFISMVELTKGLAADDSIPTTP